MQQKNGNETIVKRYFKKNTNTLTFTKILKEDLI